MSFPAQLRYFYLALAVLFCCVLCDTVVVAQKNDADQRKLVPLESILNRPDHADMPWKFQFSEPRLMYQQQYLLLIRAKIPAELLDVGGTHHVLHFVAKVQDSAGNWLPGDQYNYFEPTAKVGATKDIECKLAIYLRPGEYTVAMVAYDSTSRQVNIVRKKISIHPSEILSDLDAHLPAAEFPKDFPDGDFDQIARSDGELFAIGHPLSPFPAANTGNVRIDVVLNIARQEPEQPEPARFPTGRDHGFGRYDPYSRRSARVPTTPSRTSYRGLAIGRVLQSASLVSRLALSNGCIFVTAVDPIRMKVALPTQPAEHIDWDKTEPALLKFDQNMIDARVLQNHKGPGTFLHDLFENLSAPATCGTTPLTAHYVVVVSPTLTLPETNGDMRVSDFAGERAKFYYFHPPSENPYGDDLGKLLKSANPRRFDYKSPEAFRKALATFLSDLHAGN